VKITSDFSLSLWERERERVLRSAKTLPLCPLPKGRGGKEISLSLWEGGG
jgi:hypothetical protein